MLIARFVFKPTIHRPVPFDLFPDFAHQAGKLARLWLLPPAAAGHWQGRMHPGHIYRHIQREMRKYMLNGRL